jgi:hypothetical protein
VGSLDLEGGMVAREAGLGLREGGVMDLLGERILRRIADNPNPEPGDQAYFLRRTMGDSLREGAQSGAREDARIHNGQ